jgi:ketosteroid isomerase-like protein
MIKNLTIVLFCFAFPAANLLSQSENAGQALENLVESERSFSRMSEAKGIRAAFLEFLSEDAVVFRPKPEPGRPVYEKAPADLPVLLTWTPGYAEVSLAGDLGYTFGLSALEERLGENNPSAASSYLRIWRKTAEGKWQAALDIAVPIPQR